MVGKYWIIQNILYFIRTNENLFLVICKIIIDIHNIPYILTASIFIGCPKSCCKEWQEASWFALVRRVAGSLCRWFDKSPKTVSNLLDLLSPKSLWSPWLFFIIIQGEWWFGINHLLEPCCPASSFPKPARFADTGTLTKGLCWKSPSLPLPIGSSLRYATVLLFYCLPYITELMIAFML